MMRLARSNVDILTPSAISVTSSPSKPDHSSMKTIALGKGPTLETRMDKNRISFNASFVGITGFKSETGDFTSSPLFEDTWSVRLYPGGKAHNSPQGFLGCFIAYHGYGVIRASYKLSIVNRRGWKSKEIVSEVKSFSNTEIWGDDRFISADSFKNEDGVIENDSVIIKVEMTVYKEEQHFVRTCQPYQDLSVFTCDMNAKMSTLLIEELAALLQSESMADVTIIVNYHKNTEDGKEAEDHYSDGILDEKDVYIGEQISDKCITKSFSSTSSLDEKHVFKAHKLILCMRSPVFKAMLSSNFSEAITSKIYIEDIRPIVMESFLKYVYTGVVDTEVLETLGIDLLEAAAKYSLNALITLCESHLCNTISGENAVVFLNLSNLYCLSRLRSCTMAFIEQNSKTLICDSFLDDLAPDLMKDIIKTLSGMKLSAIDE